MNETGNDFVDTLGVGVDYFFAGATWAFFLTFICVAFVFAMSGALIGRRVDHWFHAYMAVAGWVLAAGWAVAFGAFLAAPEWHRKLIYLWVFPTFGYGVMWLVGGLSRVGFGGVGPAYTWTHEAPLPEITAAEVDRQVEVFNRVNAQVRQREAQHTIDSSNGDQPSDPAGPEVAVEGVEEDTEEDMIADHDHDYDGFDTRPRWRRWNPLRRRNPETFDVDRAEPEADLDPTDEEWLVEEFELDGVEVTATFADEPPASSRRRLIGGRR